MREKPVNFKYCEMTLYLAFKSLTEIYNIINHKSIDASPISKSDTFKFFLFTLHYTFILELTKLLELNISSRTNHFSSLKKLNIKIYNIFQKKFEEYDENEIFLNEINELEIIKKIWILRDKKVAHIDKNISYKPFNFESFSESEILELFNIINKLKKIINNCLNPYEAEFFLPSFTRTSNFLTYFEEYRAFSHSKPKEFWIWKSKFYLK